MPLSRHSVGTLSGNDLTRSSSGNTRTQSSQLAEPLWTNLGVECGISVSKLIIKNKSQAQAGNESSNILPKSSHARKKPAPFFRMLHFVCHKHESSDLHVAAFCLGRGRGGGRGQQRRTDGMT